MSLPFLELQPAFISPSRSWGCENHGRKRFSPTVWWSSSTESPDSGKPVSNRRPRSLVHSRLHLAHFVLEEQDWPKIRERTLPLAQLAGIQMEEWEHAQLSKQ